MVEFTVNSDQNGLGSTQLFRIRIRTHVHMHTCAHTCMHTYIHTYVRTHTYVRACIHTYIYAYMRTYIQKYINSHRCDIPVKVIRKSGASQKELDRTRKNPYDCRGSRISWLEYSSNAITYQPIDIPKNSIRLGIWNQHRTLGQLNEQSREPMPGLTNGSGLIEPWMEQKSVVIRLCPDENEPKLH